MSKNSKYAVSDHWDGPFDEGKFEAWAKQLRGRLSDDQVDLAFVFTTPEYDEAFHDILEIVQIHCQVKHSIGCTGYSLVSQGFEFEHGEGITVALHSLPGAKVTSFALTDQIGGDYQNSEDEEIMKSLEGFSPNGFIIFADPFSMHAEQMLVEFNRRFPAVPVLGGLACGTRERKKTTVFHKRAVLESGAVGVAIGGDVTIESVISQGCLPVGDSFTVTSAEKNILEGIANRKAYEVLSDVFDELPDSLKLKSRGNLHVGFVVDEYQHDFERGDFLVRNLIGADHK
jgi:small ligand-binding sensory domain FIST